MFWQKIFLVAISQVCTVAGGKECPSRVGPLMRVGQTEYYIAHDKSRNDFVTHKEAAQLCAANGMVLAQIRNIVTFAIVGRALERIVANEEHHDTWYWLDGVFDDEQNLYIWGNNPKDPVKLGIFLPRSTRPAGVGSHVSYRNKYLINATEPQCLTLALPWPLPKGKKAAFYGHQTVLDERPCSSRKTRHAMCQLNLPECTVTDEDPFRLSEGNLDYFNSGHWVMPNRTYIINWAPRQFKEANKLCHDIGLNLMEPGKNDKELIPFLKLWSRELTNSHFWTGLKYDAKSGQFLNSKGEEVNNIGRLNFIEGRATNARSSKLDATFCVAMGIAYEFKTQSPCPDQNSPDCTWSFIDFYAANCNNFLGTICQHGNTNERVLKWESSYTQNVDKALTDTAMADEFGYIGNTNILRSNYKQPFGVLQCPKNYRMLRSENNTNVQWAKQPKGLSVDDVFTYDYNETYWVVDDGEFDKNANSKCTVTSPATLTSDGQTRRFDKVDCTEFHFYLCEKITGLNKPSQLVSRKSAKMLWKEGPQRRVYPLLDTANSGLTSDGKCEVKKEQRLQLAFVLDTTNSMAAKFPKFVNSSKTIMTKLGETYPNISFALTATSNWDNSCFSYTKPGTGHNDTKNGCYNLLQKFTTKPDDLAEKAASLKSRGGRGTDNAVHAAAFTAADRSIGWGHVNTDENGVLLRKLLVVITDAQSITTLPKPGNRNGFRGDGSDTCETSLPVTVKQLQKVMSDNSVSVIGIYESDTIRVHYDDTWYTEAAVDHCGHIWNNDFSNIVSVVEECVKSLIEDCVFEDPMGYNTLGY